MFEQPMGGTELMFHELQKRLPERLSEFSVFNYPIYADTTKPLIYWNQLSYDQPNVEFLKQEESLTKIDRFVFVSHWQAERYRQTYNIPGFKTRVIKNALIPYTSVEYVQPANRDTTKIKICYTSTPWRGLNVLLTAWTLIPEDIRQHLELHIFTGTQIYGPDFAESEDSKYTELYEFAKNTEGIVFRGNVSNEDLRKELPSFHMLAYPNTFEETSCISVIEALASGLRVVCSNLGALPETTEGWARMYPYMANVEVHANFFAAILVEEANNIRNGDLNDHLSSQMVHFQKNWSWDARQLEWEALFNEF
jgi:glycosyltransferase involved in cell wall biosynthesis